MMEATSYAGNAGAFTGQEMAAAASDEERLAEVVARLMRNNRNVRNAILQVVMSCPNVVVEY